MKFIQLNVWTKPWRDRKCEILIFHFTASEFYQVAFDFMCFNYAQDSSALFDSYSFINDATYLRLSAGHISILHM